MPGWQGPILWADQGQPQPAAVLGRRAQRQDRQGPAPIVELPGQPLGMEHGGAPLIEPAPVQPLDPLGELLPEQAQADRQRLFPVAAIARGQGGKDDQQQDEGDHPPVSSQPTLILLRLSAHAFPPLVYHAPLASCPPPGGVKMPDHIIDRARPSSCPHQEE